MSRKLQVRSSKGIALISLCALIVFGCGYIAGWAVEGVYGGAITFLGFAINAPIFFGLVFLILGMWKLFSLIKQDDGDARKTEKGSK